MTVMERMEKEFDDQRHSGCSGGIVLGFIRQVGNGDCTIEEFRGYLEKFKKLGETADHEYNILVYQGAYDLLLIAETDDDLTAFYEKMKY